MTKEKIEKHYSDVKNVISEALESSFSEEYNSEEENAFAENVKKRLSDLNDIFKAEIDELEQNSEWDKFCISFFGETNAGKSTIIESLRIIYNEETRLQKILENQRNMQDAISENTEAYKSLIEQTQKLNGFIKNKKKTVSVGTLIFAITLTIITVSFIFINGVFEKICQLIGW